MKITRIFADSLGESHFGDIHIPLEGQGEIGLLSETFSATGVIFRMTPPDYDFGWHVAPQRQLIVLLEGEIEIEVSDGTQRVFTGGDVLLVEDTAGKGHKTKHLRHRARRSIFILLEDGVLASF